MAVPLQYYGEPIRYSLSLADVSTQAAHYDAITAEGRAALRDGSAAGRYNLLKLVLGNAPEFFNEFPEAGPANWLSSPQAKPFLNELTKSDRILAESLIRLWTQCFAAGTSILERAGRKCIDDIVPGDTILAFDETANRGRGALVPARVARVFRGTTTEWIELEGVGEGVTRVTPGHRHLRPDGTFAEIQHILAADGLTFDGSKAGIANATQFGVGISTFIGGYIARQIVAANDNSRNTAKAA